MARHAVVGSCKDGSSNDWLTQWLEERSKNPAFLHVKINRPLAAGGEIFAIVSPDLLEKNRTSCIQDLTAYPLPWSLINERLTIATGRRLDVALAAIQRIHHFPLDEAFAFFCQLFLWVAECGRAACGEPSMFVTGPTWVETDVLSSRAEERWRRLWRTPYFKLRVLLDLWDGGSWELALGDFKSPSDRIGRSSYLIIPPAFLPLEALEQIKHNSAEPSKIPLVVDLRTAHVVEPFVVSQNVFRREADVWMIIYAGQAVHVRHSKGLQYIAELLRNSGREIAAAVLVAASEGYPSMRVGPIGISVGQLVEPDSRTSAGLGDAGPMLDARAIRQYADRLDQIPTEIENARGVNDPSKMSGLKRESAWLKKELRRAMGRGGSVRMAADNAERARKAVTNRIKLALVLIQKKHPALERHLSKAIRTGFFCAYEPEAPIAWKF